MLQLRQASLLPLGGGWEVAHDLGEPGREAGGGVSLPGSFPDLWAHLVAPFQSSFPRARVFTPALLTRWAGLPMGVGLSPHRLQGRPSLICPSVPFIPGAAQMLTEVIHSFHGSFIIRHILIEHLLRIRHCSRCPAFTGE